MIPQYFSYFTILFGIIGSYLYIKETIKGTTKPNRVSWIFWTIAPFVGVYVAYKSGVSIPYLISIFMAGFTPLLVVIASFFNKKAYWKTTPFDIVCGVLSLLAIIIWVTTKNGLLSVSFAILADLFAGIPTIIKSWRHSKTETVAPYVFGILNQIITLLIITSYDFLNSGFLIYLILLNVSIVIGIKKDLFIRKAFRSLPADSTSHSK